MATGQKRELLMTLRRERPRRLIDVYYQERGWNPSGIPLPETLKELGLWEFLADEARTVITDLTKE
jgi:aldehyde:ferredoxin oxidoreductase